MAEKRISHDGIIDSLEGDDVVVRITGYADCQSCHARGACNVTDEKYMKVRSGSGQFNTGDRVRIVLAQSIGFRALFLGYILPFFLVLTILLALSAAGFPEGVAGLASLASLLPYYLGLKLFRRRIERRFSLQLQKT